MTRVLLVLGLLLAPLVPVHAQSARRPPVIPAGAPLRVKPLGHGWIQGTLLGVSDTVILYRSNGVQLTTALPAVEWIATRRSRVRVGAVIGAVAGVFASTIAARRATTGCVGGCDSFAAEATRTLRYALPYCIIAGAVVGSFFDGWTRTWP